MEIRVRAENMDAAAAAEGKDDVVEFLKSEMVDFLARETLRRNMTVNEKFYKSATFDVAESSAPPAPVSAAAPTDRREWWHLLYQQQYEPDSAYELALQWSVSTGALIGKVGVFMTHI